MSFSRHETSILIGVLLGLVLGVAAWPLDAQTPETADPSASVDGAGDVSAAAEAESVRRTTVAPWSVDVLGKSYDNFTNEEASVVLNDWLINAMMRMPVFHVVNRDKIQATLSEQQLVASGYAEDVSTTALATAGRLLKLNYIILGNFKNLGKTSEIDFKLLDVDSATYEHTFNFEIPFNPALESVKAEIDRVVASLAAEFPIEADIYEVRSANTLALTVGVDDGVAEDMEVVILDSWSSEVVARGFVLEATPQGTVVEVDGDVSDLVIYENYARIKVVPPAQASLNRGMRYFRQGRYAEASDVFAKGLELDGQDALLQAAFARCRHHLRDYDQALPSYRNALALRPDDRDLVHDTARAMLEAGRFQEIVDLLVATAEQQSSDLLYLLGLALESQGYEQRAYDAFRSAVRQPADHALSRLRLALNALARDDPDEARQELEKATQTKPSLLAVRLVGSLVDGQGESDRLAAQAREAGDFAALTLGAEVLGRLPGRWRDSLAWARDALEVNPHYLRALLVAAEALAAGGEYAEAVAMLEQASADAADNYAVQMRLASLLIGLESFTDAQSRLRRASELAPTDWRPARLLGDIHARLDQSLEAAEAYQDALEKAESEEPEDLVDLLYDLGRALSEGGQATRATPHLERCTSLAPAHRDCQFHLGLAYFRAGTLDDRALNAFRAAEGIDERAYFLACLYEERHEIEAAAAAFQQCLETNCGHVEESRQRLDRIESITAKIVDGRGNTSGKEGWVTLSAGSAHGVRNGMKAVVVGDFAGTLRIDRVDELTSVAIVDKGTAPVGQVVRFRPTRPKGVNAAPDIKKGVRVRWQRNPEREVDHYLVYRSENPNAQGTQIKRVAATRQAAMVDKSVKPGKAYYYTVVAVSRIDAKSLPSARVAYQVPGA